jgi:hypothetical protein
MNPHMDAPHVNVPPAPQALAVALSPRLIEPVLRSFVKKTFALDGVSHSANGGCHILDAKYEPGKRCSILYELHEQLIIGELTWPNAGGNRPVASPLLPTMRLYPFAHDPDLPTLTTAIDGNAMQPLLNSSLPDCVAGEQQIVRCRATLLRYRLGKRCTLRYDLWLRNRHSGAVTTRTLFGKLYHCAAKAAAVYQEMQMLTATKRRRGLAVAAAVAYLPALPLVLQAPVAVGAPLEWLLQQPPSAAPAQLERVRAGIRRAATALANLHQSPVRTSRIRSVDAELTKLERRSRRIAELDTTGGTALHQLAQALLGQREQLHSWGEEITVVHGDCKPSQFFLLPEAEMALLDFDHCGMADPAADVGNFLATLRQMGIRQQLKTRASAPAAAWQRWLATLEDTFLDEYVASDPSAAAFRRRAIWYQAMALLRKALRSYARSPRSPLTALLVQEAWQLLAAIP